MTNNKIIYMRVGYMKNYSGLENDSIVNGGSYITQNKSGNEIYNFKSSKDGWYYGFAQLTHGTINIDRITTNRLGDCLCGMTVVFIANRPNIGTVIVGWYEDAILYKHNKILSEEQLNISNRENKDIKEYSCKSRRAILLSEDERNIIINGAGQSNIWYGTDSVNAEILEYINKYDGINKYDIDLYRKVDNIQCFYEPTNPLQWNLFTEIKSVGHIEKFRATQEMKAGDILLIAIGKQLEYENELAITKKKGIYAIGIILNNPYILDNKKYKGDFCYNKLTVDVSIIKIRKDKPIKQLDNINITGNFRAVNKINQQYNDLILTVLNN